VKLSEAIRAGAGVYPQARRVYIEQSAEVGAVLAVCPMISGYLAVFGRVPRVVIPNAWEDDLFAALETPRFTENKLMLWDGKFTVDLGSAVMHMNDTTSMTTEQIAGWLAERGF
jgi:hypothetical protein